MTSSPAPMSTLPWGALIVPSLTMRAATRATVPPAAVVMRPWLITALPLAAPVPPKWSRPAMKSAFVMSSVDATRPPTSTRAVLVKVTPFGFTRYTWPLALSVPWISEGSEPVTRLSATASAVGCTKRTCRPCPMSNEDQSIARRALSWLIVRPFAAGVIEPLPATTWPPAGNGSPANADDAASDASAATCIRRATRPADVDRARPRPASETACQTPLHAFQTTR